ncbi:MULTISPECIES: hypothetical protein [Streptomyces]|uniref:Uncharacterized protein n=1 Tax=Streptomyces cinereoruber TaxID=67260 RepID=A0AAV4KHK4_9ACTN|nr:MULTISPECIES: hypothetical protein [Streptomyces]AVH98962.1 hypothetical protein C5L38_31160 [Streptomyces sp. WAC00288]KYG52147.1 hypothetical protein AWI43_22940 [Streptomyces sp. WAC04657]MBB4160346.1 hypothetical protein [Streptomyces cinereoruber]MBY8819012.1 hypothetical protein [Streptomyces cinereoruber]NIH63135.1 hypothetical protein [Streptomyces cinereoruber]
MAQASRPVPAADEVRAALEDVSDPTARAVVLALLAVRDELRAVSERTGRVDARMKQMNQYLGALANKP